MSDMFDKAKTRILERIETPRDFLEYKLGTALTMENNILDMLDRLQEEAKGSELKQQLRHHADETRSQVENLEQAFAAMGVEANDRPCPSVEALDKEARMNIKIADDRMVDAVILSGAAETEHHEIGAYETLITHAEALGENVVADRLRQNLEQEKHMLEEVKHATQKYAGDLAHQTA
jgi:ferritin-like metal-binding protein YciE